nr:hypothetical protein [Saccharofermentans sp.]
DDNNYTPESETADKQATASVILGIVGLCLCCCMPCGVAGLICALMAKKNGATGGKVTAGLVMAIIILVMTVISWIYSAISGGVAGMTEMLEQYY